MQFAELTARRAVHVLQEVLSQLLLLLIVPLLCSDLNNALQRLGQLGPPNRLLVLTPFGEGSKIRDALWRLRGDSRFIPGHRAVVLREGPASNHVACLQAYLRNWHVQPHPAAGFRQRTHQHALTGLVSSPVDLVLTPVGPVLPTTYVPLQHDLL